jgi:hypothetical protein
MTRAWVFFRDLDGSPVTEGLSPIVAGNWYRIYDAWPDPLAALRLAPGPWVALCDDRVVLWIYDATDELRAFARALADQVMQLSRSISNRIDHECAITAARATAWHRQRLMTPKMSPSRILERTLLEGATKRGLRWRP